MTHVALAALVFALTFGVARANEHAMPAADHGVAASTASAGSDETTAAATTAVTTAVAGHNEHAEAAAAHEGAHEDHTAHAKLLLLFATINFLLFAGLMTYLLRKPLHEFLVRRAREINADMDRIARERDAAQARLDAATRRQAALGAETTAVREEIVSLAQRDAERRVADARAQAQAAENTARQRAANLEREAQLRLIDRAVDLLGVAVGAELRTQVDAGRDQRLGDTFAERLS